MLLTDEGFIKVNIKLSHERKGSQSKEVDEWR